jgi:hypothetical protein
LGSWAAHGVTDEDLRLDVKLPDHIEIPVVCQTIRVFDK